MRFKIREHSCAKIRLKSTLKVNWPIRFKNDGRDVGDRISISVTSFEGLGSVNLKRQWVIDKNFL